jgi:hypothetical protein
VAGGTVHIPWYATGLRHDDLAEALAEISPVALRHGATEHAVHRSRDDLYKFLQIAAFPDKESWERYWFGEEFVEWRARHSSWYQVPVLYVWHDVVVQAALPQAAPAGSD